MSEQDTTGLPPGGPETAAPEGPQVKGLDAHIQGAIQEHMPDERPASEHHDADPDAGPQRDERGRFVAKSPAPENAPADGQAADPGADPAAEGDEEPKTPETQAVEAPRNFTAEQKAEFAKLPPEAQQMLAGIEKAREAEYTRRQMETANFRRAAEPLLQVVQPHAEYLNEQARQYGVAPTELIGQLLVAERTLRQGSPQQKAEALAQVMADYGIDLSLVTGDQGHAPNPVINQLRQTVSQLEGRLSQYERNQTADIERQAEASINAFINAKNEDGSPKHPHFEAVKGVMGHLIATGEADDIEDAYQKAAAPIEAQINAALGKRAETEAASRREAVDRAKRAGSPVRSSGSVPGGQQTGKRGLDAIISEAVAKHWN